MKLSLNRDEARLILNALDTKILFIEDIEETDPADAIPYRELYRKIYFELNKVND